MKVRKNIRDVFKHASAQAQLATAVITELKTYPTSVEAPNDFYVYYTYSGTKRISFADGVEVVV